MTSTDSRPLRVCDACGGVDDHPRHVMHAPGAPLAVPSRDVVDRTLATLADQHQMGDVVEAIRGILDTLGYEKAAYAAVAEAAGIGGRLGRMLGASPKAVDAIGMLGPLFDTATIQRHMDCCRALGCPDGACAVVTAGAEHLCGAELVRHLTSREG